MDPFRVPLLTAAAFALLSASIQAAEIGPGGDLRAAIATLEPGDELLLQGGTYSFSSGFRITVNGTAAAPVVIRAKGPDAPVIHQTSPNHNVIEIQNSSHLELRGITKGTAAADFNFDF